LAALVGMAAEQFGGGGWGAGACVEQGDAHLAAGKGAVEDGKIAHDDGEKAETGSGFKNDKDAGGSGSRQYVSQTQGEDGGSADVEVGEKAGLCDASLKGLPRAWKMSAKPTTMTLAHITSRKISDMGP